MGRSYRPGIGARGVIGIVAAVVECSVSKAVMHKCQLSAMSGRWPQMKIDAQRTR